MIAQTVQIITAHSGVQTPEASGLQDMNVILWSLIAYAAWLAFVIMRAVPSDRGKK